MENTEERCKEEMHVANQKAGQVTLTKVSNNALFRNSQIYAGNNSAYMIQNCICGNVVNKRYCKLYEARKAKRKSLPIMLITPSVRGFYWHWIIN